MITSRRWRCCGCGLIRHGRWEDAGGIPVPGRGGAERGTLAGAGRHFGVRSGADCAGEPSDAQMHTRDFRVCGAPL